MMYPEFSGGVFGVASHPRRKQRGISINNQRFRLLDINKEHISQLIKSLKKNLTDSIIKNKDFFLKNCNNILIFSGGFKEFIVPVIKDFKIPEKNIFANEFIFNKDGSVIGYDKNNLMAQENGKIMQLEALNIKEDIYVIGDGYNDYMLKKLGLAKKFFAFTENIYRKKTTENADYILKDFEEFVDASYSL